jgi:hypothetical protein
MTKNLPDSDTSFYTELRLVYHRHNLLIHRRKHRMPNAHVRLILKCQPVLLKNSLISELPLYCCIALQKLLRLKMQQRHGRMEKHQKRRPIYKLVNPGRIVQMVPTIYLLLFCYRYTKHLDPLSR